MSPAPYDLGGAEPAGGKPTVVQTTPAVRLSPSEQTRRRQLAVTKRRATTLLAAVSVIFLAATIWGNSSSWVGYVQATAAASMVGGLADWFAVTALFRRPLGLPIPHTAIVVERKDQFAATLGEFIQDSFLTPELILGRVRSADVVNRLADWLCQADNASRAAAELADAIVAAAKLARDEDVHRTLEGFLRQGVESLPLAPLAGQALRFVLRDGRADELLDRAFREVKEYLEEHREELRSLLTKRSRWWLPGAVDHKLFDRVIDGACAVLGEMADDHDHAVRQQLNDRLAQLAGDLETSPALLARGEQLKHDFLARPEVQKWVAALWSDIKRHLEAQASNPTSVLRHRLTGAIVGIGGRLHEDPTLANKVRDAVESVVCYVAEHFNSSIAGLVSNTVSRWDAEETASRLELLLGPDLQFVRINGTVVGAGAGLLLHVVSRVLA
jgi:uncharacterized membrane-anchored protein YjiN (DUF445 family)